MCCTCKCKYSPSRGSYRHPDQASTQTAIVASPAIQIISLTTSRSFSRIMIQPETQTFLEHHRVDREGEAQELDLKCTTMEIHPVRT